MDNNKVNVRILNNAVNEVIFLINDINLEINELLKHSDVISDLCVELKESNGKKIAVNGIGTGEEISPQLGFKRCRVYGLNELETQINSLKKILINILDGMDSIYVKVKLNLETSDNIGTNVGNIENVLAGGAEAMVFQDYMIHQNDSLITPEQVSSAVESNFNQNRDLTNRVSSEVSLRVYEKLQKMVKSSGGDRF